MERSYLNLFSWSWSYNSCQNHEKAICTATQNKSTELTFASNVGVDPNKVKWGCRQGRRRRKKPGSFTVYLEVFMTNIHNRLHAQHFTYILEKTCLEKNKNFLTSSLSNESYAPTLFGSNPSEKFTNAIAVSHLHFVMKELGLCIIWKESKWQETSIERLRSEIMLNGRNMCRICCTLKRT